MKRMYLRHLTSLIWLFAVSGVVLFFSISDVTTFLHTKNESVCQLHCFEQCLIFTPLDKKSAPIFWHKMSLTKSDQNMQKGTLWKNVSYMTFDTNPTKYIAYAVNKKYFCFLLGGTLLLAQAEENGNTVLEDSLFLGYNAHARPGVALVNVTHSFLIIRFIDMHAVRENVSGMKWRSCIAQYLDSNLWQNMINIF